MLPLPACTDLDLSGNDIWDRWLHPFLQECCPVLQTLQLAGYTGLRNLRLAIE